MRVSLRLKIFSAFVAIVALMGGIGAVTVGQVGGLAQDTTSAAWPACAWSATPWRRRCACASAS
jgi:hypothetical protein